jgi:hypothetical protein
MMPLPEKPKSPSTPYHALVLKIFAPGNKKVLATKIYKAGKGHVFNEDGVQRILEDMGDQLERQLPGQDFRLVELSGGRFNFINVTEELPPDEILFEANVSEG